MSKNYVDVKVTLWSRAYFNDEADMNKIVDLIKNDNLGDIYDDNLNFSESEILYDTEEIVYNDQDSSKERKILPVCEVYQNNEIIYENTI